MVTPRPRSLLLAAFLTSGAALAEPAPLASERVGAALLQYLPAFAFQKAWLLELWQWAGLLVVLAVAGFLALLLERLVLALGTRAARMSDSKWDDQLAAAGRGPLRYPLFAALLAVGGRLLSLPPLVQGPLDAIARSISVVALGWFGLRMVALGAAFVEGRAAGDGAEPGRIRAVKTQLAILRRVFQLAIYLVMLSVLLVQFDSVRNVGVSLLASAGIAGLVFGLAAQKSISTLLAGIQLSLTQPVRIGDTVIVENEWGQIEEITLTYVVVKVWDLRRLIVPMTYFLEKPFQNWTKAASDLLGTVEVRADFRTGVDSVRAELGRILKEEGKALWDGKVQGVQVTETSERAMTVRALVSASDAGKLWDLRCLVREKLIAFLAQTPDALPTLRSESAARALPGGERPELPPNTLRIDPDR